MVSPAQQTRSLGGNLGGQPSPSSWEWLLWAGGALPRGCDCGFKGKEEELGGELRENCSLLFFSFHMCWRTKPGWCPAGSSCCSGVGTGVWAEGSGLNVNSTEPPVGTEPKSRKAFHGIGNIFLISSMLLYIDH